MYLTTKGALSVPIEAQATVADEQNEVEVEKKAAPTQMITAAAARMLMRYHQLKLSVG